MQFHFNSIITVAIFVILGAGTLQAQLAKSWIGPLDAGGQTIRLVFNLEESDGGYSGTMDSPDQGAKGIPIDEVRFTNGEVNISIAGGAITYHGTLKDDQIEGTFSQSGMEFPLTLVPLGELQGPPRPQTPVEPFPYQVENVRYQNDKAGIEIGGTLTLPKGEGPFPVALLISGSGQQDRDETIMDHKPFAVIADALTKEGIAVLRVDDRGVGETGGNPNISTTADFADDVEAGIAYLQSRKEIDPQKIGLIGHSEGGIIAPMVAARNEAVSFIITLAAPGVSGQELLPMQENLLLGGLGIDETVLEKWGPIRDKAYEIVLSESNPITALNNLETMLLKEMEVFSAQEKQMLGLREDQLKAKFAPLLTPWYKFFLAYDPAEDWAKVNCPVLALNGEKDTQVPAKENLAAIAAQFSGDRREQLQTQSFPDLNHLFQTATTGLPMEYGQIEETIAPSVLETMSSWILAL